MQRNTASAAPAGNIKGPVAYLLLEAALTDEAASREVYKKGIDLSYFHESHATFKSTEL